MQDDARGVSECVLALRRTVPHSSVVPCQSVAERLLTLRDLVQLFHRLLSARRRKRCIRVRSGVTTDCTTQQCGSVPVRGGAVARAWDIVQLFHRLLRARRRKRCIRVRSGVTTHAGGLDDARVWFRASTAWTTRGVVEPRVRTVGLLSSPSRSREHVCTSTQRQSFAPQQTSDRELRRNGL